MRVLLRIYDPVLDWALAHRRKTVLAGAAALLACALGRGVRPARVGGAQLEAGGWQEAACAARGMGSEFMPTLNEGSLLFMPVLLPSTSLTEVKRIMAWQDRVMSQVPEVASVGGQTRPRRNRHRPGAGRDDRDHDHAQAGIHRHQPHCLGLLGFPDRAQPGGVRA